MESDSSLNSLYDDVLRVAFEIAGDEREVVTKVLQAICVAREPLTTEMVDELLGLESGIAQRVVIKFSSVLSDGSYGAAIYVLHPTFLEYLQSPLRNPPIVTIPEAEALMAKGCLKVLLSGLEYNISQPSTYWRNMRRNESEDIDLEQQLHKSATPALHYAAFHGLSHVAASLQVVEVIQDLRGFLQSKLLNWIALMGWYQEVRTVMGSVHDLKMRIEEMLGSTKPLVSMDSVTSSGA